MSRFKLVPNPTATTAAERSTALAHPSFGEYFADHMALACWTKEAGWHDLTLAPMGPLTMHPSAGVLHYGQEIFEGLKAYRHADDSIWLFRPEMNAARFTRSAVRLSMPPLPPEIFIDSLLDLVDAERRWVPQPDNEQSLYLRPFELATEAYVGVRASKVYTYCVLGTPVGAYYPEPVKLWITPTFTRAAPGGTGAAKCGGNYAASLAAAAEAAEHGCGQVLYLDGAEHRWLEECGTMNVMLITRDGELLTPALGTILDGVTRDSILQLAPEHGLRPVERRIAVSELIEGLRAGTITEVLACGTAAVVTPITGFRSPDWEGDLWVGDGQPGGKTRAIRAHLLDIQYGRVPDTRAWMRRVDPRS